MYLVKKSGQIPGSWNRVLRGPTFWADLKWELRLFRKAHENRILLKTDCDGTKGGFRKMWKANYLMAAALYNQLRERDRIVICLLQKMQQSYCSPSCWVQTMLGWMLLQTLEDVWLWDFRGFQKYTKCRKTSLLCQNTSALCLHYIFPFYMLEIIRPLTALIRLNIGEGKWEAAQSILSWNLLSHLSLKCKYGLRPALPVPMTLAEGGRYGSHFPSRCSSCFPQTQQRHKISLTSDSEKVDNHFFVVPSSLGKAAAYYSILSKIIPIRLWYEYWNISPIRAQCCSLNMPIVFTVSITYFKWHGMIIYVNITSAEAEWCLAKQKRLSDLLGPWFQGKRCQGTLGGGQWLLKGVKWIDQWVLPY